MRLRRREPSSKARCERRGHRGVWLCAAWLLLGACDPVKGLQESGNAVLSPATTRYINGPGTRLTKGRFRSASYAWTRQDHYVLARSADTASNSLFVMSQANPEPCELPEVLRFTGPISSE